MSECEICHGKGYVIERVRDYPERLVCAECMGRGIIVKRDAYHPILVRKAPT